MFSFSEEKSEILLYDVIGESHDGEGIHAASVEAALQLMDGARVTIRINSPGGIADEGVAIYNTLKRYPGGVDTVIDSLAASAASIVALAGETRTAMTGSRWMIHSAMGIAMGNAADMRKMTEVLTVYDNSLASIYALYMGLPQSEVLDLMAEETWYDGAAALAAGLATSVDGNESKQKPQNAAWFAHPPSDLLDSPLARLKPAPVARELARARLRLVR